MLNLKKNKKNAMKTILKKTDQKMISQLCQKNQRVKCYSINLTEKQREQADARKRKENNKTPIRKKFDKIQKNAKLKALQKRRNKREKMNYDKIRLKIC